MPDTKIHYTEILNVLLRKRKLALRAPKRQLVQNLPKDEKGYYRMWEGLPVSIITDLVNLALKPETVSSNAVRGRLNQLIEKRILAVRELELPGTNAQIFYVPDKVDLNELEQIYLDEGRVADLLTSDFLMHHVKRYKRFYEAARHQMFEELGAFYEQQIFRERELRDEGLL